MASDAIHEAAKACRKFEDDWQYYYTPGQGIGNPVHVPWEMWEKYKLLSAAAIAEHPADDAITDKERLDWLEESEATTVQDFRGRNLIDDEDGAGLRSCIDAAMRPEAPECSG